MDSNQLKQFVESNPKLVRVRENANGTKILKYSKRVFYDDLWNEELEWCRGTIVDQNFNLVQLPFQKIYNFGVEKKAPAIDDNELITAYRKVNGFMVAVTWHKGDILVSTTGSVESDYVDMAKEMMLSHMSWKDWQMEVFAAVGYSLMFECVHPDDPHVIVEQPGMYFLGHRLKTWDSKLDGFGVETATSWENYATKSLNCFAAESYVIPFGELRKKIKTVRHEGFVVYTEDGRATKIKSPYYLTSKWVCRNPRTDKLMNDSIFGHIDEEYYPLIHAIRKNIIQYNAMDEQQRLEWVRSYFDGEQQ